MPSIPDDLVGHDKERGQLLQDIATGNVSHAYLFAGQPHLGKFTLATWFAWRLLVDHLPPDKRKAERERMEKFIHPDFLCLGDLWIEGVNDDWTAIGRSSNIPQQHRSKNPTAKTDVIGIEEIRAISERLLSTGQSPYFCCVIRGIERMQPASATSFLKILEEPPPRVVFLLTTDAPNMLLPTIISRTRFMNFHPLQRGEMLPLLQGRDDEDATFALHLARGAPGMLFELLSDPDRLRAEKQLHSQAKQFWQTKSLKERLAWLMQVTEKRQDIDAVVLHLGLTMRELPNPEHRSACIRAFTELAKQLKTNAHRGLLLERFALALQENPC